MKVTSTTTTTTAKGSSSSTILDYYDGSSLLSVKWKNGTNNSNSSTNMSLFCYSTERSFSLWLPHQPSTTTSTFVQHLPKSSSNSNKQQEENETLTNSILATSTTTSTRVVAPKPSTVTDGSTTPVPGEGGDLNPGRSSSGGGGSNSNSSSKYYSSTSPPRAYLADMKGPFEHLMPKALVLSTVKVGLQQGGNVMMNILSEQLEEDRKRYELVNDGLLTPEQAEEQSLEWEKNEWEVQTKIFPRRYGIALLRFHSCTLIMRLYEHIVLHHTSCKVSLVDKLTKDPASSAKRKLERANIEQKNKKSSKEIHHEVATQMFTTTLYSNAIAFLADITVQECILMFSYSMYCYHHIIKNRQQNINNKKEKKQEEASTNNDDEEALSITSLGGIYLSFLMKSGSVVTSRLMGWIFAAGGSVVGTYFLPGWGTIIGTQLGDNLAGTLFEHVTTTTSSSS